MSYFSRIECSLNFLPTVFIIFLILECCLYAAFSRLEPFKSYQYNSTSALQGINISVFISKLLPYASHFSCRKLPHIIRKYTGQMQYWCIASTMFAITDLTLCVNKLYVNLTVDRPFETVSVAHESFVYRNYTSLRFLWI